MEGQPKRGDDRLHHQKSRKALCDPRVCSSCGMMGVGVEGHTMAESRETEKEELLLPQCEPHQYMEAFRQ